MDDQTGAAAGVAMLVLVVALYIAVIGFAIYLYVRVARKAGYSGWWTLLLFVPLVNIVVMVLFAFQEWPIERELRAARTALVGGAGGHRQLPPAGGYPHPVGGGSGGYGNPALSGPPAYGSGYGYPPATSATEPLPSSPVFGRPDPERPTT